MNIIDSDANPLCFLHRQKLMCVSYSVLSVYVKHSIILSMVMCLSLAHTLSVDKVYTSGVSIHICPFEALFMSMSVTY